MRVLLALLLATSLHAQQQRGPFIEDIDRTADACTNFFDYANGAWRKAKPIPASMNRWSRRWASGELSKDQLRVILDEVTKRNDWPKGSVDQQIGDFYSSCMDEQRVNALGSKPVEPLFARIDSIRSTADLQEVIAELHALQMNVPFGLTSSPDNHNPRDVVARVYAAGLGLPDRDYYLKPDQRFADARVKYREHVAKMFELAGSSKAAAKRNADAVFELETRLAKWHLDNVQLRDPSTTDRKYYVTTLQKMTPRFDWSRYLHDLRVEDLQVDQPLFMMAVDRELTATPLAAWRAYLKWSVLNAAAPHLSDDFATADWSFYSKYLRGAKEMKPRWKRCVETTDQLLGEALGRRYVDRFFRRRRRRACRRWWRTSSPPWATPSAAWSG